MPTHICKQCGERKAVKEFNRHHRQGPYEPWNLSICKNCSHRRYEQRRAVPRQLRKLHKASRAWKQTNPERHAKLAREYRERHPEKIVAQNRLNYAVRKGRVVRLPCEVCGTTDRVHGHHPSYDPKDWYNVRWLCSVCHTSEHMPA